MNLWYALILEASIWLNGGIMQYEPLDALYIDKPIAAQIGAELGYGPVFVHASVLTDMFVYDLADYWPFNNTYNAGAGLRYKGLEVGLEHSCYHPMVPFQWFPWQKAVVPAFEGSMSRLYVRLRVEGGAR